MVHLPLLTLISISSRGKWYCGRNISVGKVSFSAELVVSKDSQISERVNVALRRSKPVDCRVPAV